MNEKVCFFDAKPYDIKMFDEVNQEFGFNLKYFSSKLNEDTVTLAKNYKIICAFVNDDINENVVEELYKNGTRLIALRCAGFNNVAMLSAYKKIDVVRVPSYSPHAVAEHAVALAMSLNRKTHRAYYRTRDNNFNINGFMGVDFYGKTCGVVGSGKIGQIFAKIMSGFGMDVIAYDPFPNEQAAKENNFSYVSLEELFKKSDLISLHCPMTSENVYMINKDSIAVMKDDVIIINTGRGKLINSKDLIDALKNSRIGGAGLDVYEEEEKYFFEDFSSDIIQDDTLVRLLSFPNVLVTSHQAFFTKEAMQAIAQTTLQNMQDFVDGKELKNAICNNCKDHPRRCTMKRLTK
ncbi:MAG: 2-hydroxyacid dehydrogenase [Kiritimatiellae bacterium]|jgi:D-lactate dehydrogenase|nr:2-hydroxyacid dehydrogenase [Kiritimatiellia bacterium]